MPTDQRADPRDSYQLPSFRALYLLTGVVGLLVVADLLLWWLGYESLRNPWGVNLALLAAVLGGARIVYSALVSLLEGDVGADLALAFALIAALLLKEYWVGAEVVLIAMVGESLEALTFSRTHREIRRIFELQPRTLRLRRGEQVAEATLDEVRHGDVVVIRPGERVPIDGRVVEGRSAVDQSTLTGESIPVDKGPGDEVFAGTMNQFGALEVRTARIGAETTLGQVIELVTQARRNKSRVERVADRMARYFLPLVLLLAAGTFVATNFVRLQGQVTGAESTGAWVWMPTLAVLVVSCPCALILATPAAVMAALAWLARRGVLTTGGAALERLALVSRFAFDKTGTLTLGQLEIGQCIAVDQQDSTEVLMLAAAAEASSEHHIGRAIVEAARQRGGQVPPVEDFEALPGAGVAARLPARDASSARALLVGNRRLMVERAVRIPAEIDAAAERAEAEGQTPLLVAVDGAALGVIGVRDRVRPEAAQVIAQLGELGIGEIVLLTGDRETTARQVARAVGIERFEAELRPQEKANWLADWTETEGGDRAGRQRPLVAMVGDGVNDAPALACADVGIALGGVGSDITAEAGDLILMGDPLAPLPGLVRLSRETLRVIRQNIILFAFGVNFLGIALTAWIMPTWSAEWHARSPVAAALFHQLGSLLVLLNAMRLLWFERWEATRLGRVERAVGRACGRLAGQLRPAADTLRWLWAARGGLLRLAVLLLVAGYLTQIVVFVQPDEVAVVQRFGRFHAVLQPGPHLRLPPPWDRIVRERPQRVRVVETGLQTVADSAQPSDEAAIEWNTLHTAAMNGVRAEEAVALTGDQSLVELAATVQYRISDIRAFRFGVREPQRVLRTLVVSAIREVIAAHPLLVDESSGDQAQEILTIARGRLEAGIAQLVQERADNLGLGIELLEQGVCLREVHPPLPVVDAFRDVSNAFKEKERMRNQADAYHRDRIIQAAGATAWSRIVEQGQAIDPRFWEQLRGELAGEAAVELNVAEAYAVGRQQLATGEVAGFQSREAAHAAAPELTEWRLFVDALSATLPDKRKLILDDQAAGRRHLLLGLPPGVPSQQFPAFGQPLLEHEE